MTAEPIIQDAEAQVTELNDECERLRARVAELESDVNSIQVEAWREREKLRAERDETMLTEIAAQACKEREMLRDALANYRDEMRKKLAERDATIARLRFLVEQAIGALRQARFTELADSLRIALAEQPATANELPKGDV